MFTRSTHFALGADGATTVSLPAVAGVQPFPPGFQVLNIETDGATIHVRVGGKGPAVVLLHGFGDTGDMWAPLAAVLARDHTVVVPDLRGMGLSSHPEDGYDKKTQAGDMIRVLDCLKVEKVDLVTHDIGNMVGYAFAAQYPDRVTRFVALDAPIPGIGKWDEIITSPALWHFNFRGADVERLVRGRERIYLDRFWNEFSANPKAIDEATRQHYAALYARPGAMHSAFNQFAAFQQDAEDNKAFAATGKLTMPVLAIGADKSFGPAMAEDLRYVATDVTELVIANSGHWLMEEQPAATVAAIRAFLDRQPRGAETSGVPSFPPGFRTQEIQNGDASIHVRIGGKGPAVVMLHGFGDTGDVWAPLAAALLADHTIVVPDLRGMGLSSHPEGGYDKKTQAGDIARVLDVLEIDKADLVTHDIGNMVGYAFAALYPNRVTRFIAMDAFLPGIGPWDESLRNPALWHFNFRGPDVERLVVGRERIYLDRFWNERSANPKSIDEATRQHYAALYARPGAMHSAFNQFAAFAQDAIDNKAMAEKSKLMMPVLAIGAEKGYGTSMEEDLGFVANNVTGAVIANSGHWIMEEQPAAAIAVIRKFLNAQ